MASLGCPKCGRTPVTYFTSSRKWVCRNCKHEWSNTASDGSQWEDNWGPNYVINQEVVERLRKKAAALPKKTRSVAKKAATKKPTKKTKPAAKPDRSRKSKKR